MINSIAPDHEREYCNYSSIRHVLSCSLAMIYWDHLSEEAPHHSLTHKHTHTLKKTNLKHCDYFSFKVTQITKKHIYSHPPHGAISSHGFTCLGFEISICDISVSTQKQQQLILQIFIRSHDGLSKDYSCIISFSLYNIRTWCKKKRKKEHPTDKSDVLVCLKN